jgi:hypothetical protein
MSELTRLPFSYGKLTDGSLLIESGLRACDDFVVGDRRRCSKKQPRTTTRWAAVSPRARLEKEFAGKATPTTATLTTIYHEQTDSQMRLTRLCAYDNQATLPSVSQLAMSR